MKLVRTYPFSKIKEGTSLDILSQKALPVGIPYKMYLDSRGIDNYSLVVNVNSELDIHFIQDKKLDLKNSLILKDSSLEFHIENLTNDRLISKIIDYQLSIVFSTIDEEKESHKYTINNIIYLENTTDYITYYNKHDSYLLNDPLWKLRELEQLRIYSENLDKKE